MVRTVTKTASVILICFSWQLGEMSYFVSRTVPGTHQAPDRKGRREEGRKGGRKEGREGGTGEEERGRERRVGIQKCFEGFPGDAVVENLPANTGDTGSSPGLGRYHMPRSNWAREPRLLSLRVWSLCSATREAAIVRPVHRNEEWSPLATTRGSPHTETKTQHSQK